MLLIKCYPEEVGCGTAGHDTVFDLVLVGQIIDVSYGFIHLLHRQESGQIGGVGRDHDQREEPPHARYYACRHCPAINVLRITSLFI